MKDTANSIDTTGTFTTIFDTTTTPITISSSNTITISSTTINSTYYVKPRKNVVLHISPSTYYDEGEMYDLIDIDGAPNLKFQLI